MRYLHNKLDIDQQKINWNIEEVARLSKSNIERMKTETQVFESPELGVQKVEDESFFKELQELEDRFSNREANDVH